MFAQGDECRACDLRLLAAQLHSLVVPALGAEARRSAHRGTRPCTGRSGRPRPHLSSCAAIARGSARGSTWRSRSRRTAERAGRRLPPPSIAGTSSPPLPYGLRVKVLCDWTARCALCRPCGVEPCVSWQTENQARRQTCAVFRGGIYYRQRDDSDNKVERHTASM
eukprot:scaffold17240_cov65-Phaeocystis_antarctica.AAC.1